MSSAPPGCPGLFLSLHSLVVVAGRLCQYQPFEIVEGPSLPLLLSSLPLLSESLLYERVLISNLVGRVGAAAARGQPQACLSSQTSMEHLLGLGLAFAVFLVLWVVEGWNWAACISGNLPPS